jgi:hypothetical protein
MSKIFRFFKINWSWYILFAIAGVAIYRLKFDSIHAYIVEVFITTVGMLIQFENSPHPKSAAHPGQSHPRKEMTSTRMALIVLKVFFVLMVLLYLSWEAYNFYLSLGRN